MSTKLLWWTGSDLSEKLCFAMDILHGADGETRNAPRAKRAQSETDNPTSSVFGLGGP
jgi:hypothetical protein